MKYKLTDGRPWYKQVVSGIVLSALICFFTPMIVLMLVIASTVTHTVYLEYGITGILSRVAIVLLGFIAMKIFFSIIDWAFGGNP